MMLYPSTISRSMTLEAQPGRRANQLDLGLQPQLAAYVGDVGLYRPLADVELHANFARGISLRRQHGDLAFSLGEHLDTGSARDLRSPDRPLPREQLRQAAGVEPDHEAEHDVSGRPGHRGRGAHRA